MHIPRVSNMTSSRGNKIANQFVIDTPEGQVFQSYETIIAVRQWLPKSKILLDRESWDYSTTTGKYRNIFLGETKAKTERKIKSGEYELADLNGGK